MLNATRCKFLFYFYFPYPPAHSLFHFHLDAIKSQNLVSASWLLKNVGKVVTVDCSWHLPSANRDAKQEFIKKHITNARFFDIDEISDKSSCFPHMLPDHNRFGQLIGDMGIVEDTDLVLYDTHGLFSVARAWYMFKGKNNLIIIVNVFWRCL
jgi:thiosulfate/3-mercaptopyruvate sulfurtransferase